MRTECPICGLPGLQSNDCETEPIDCIFCPRCGWVGDGEIAEEPPQGDNEPFDPNDLSDEEYHDWMHDHGAL